MTTYAATRANIDTYATTTTDHPTIGLMGDTRTEPNRTQTYTDPSYSDGWEGTSFAYIETTYTYRGDQWSVSAYATIREGRNGTTGPVLDFDLSTAHNIDKRATYGRFERATLTDAQRVAALTALHATTGTEAPTEPYGDAPIKITKREVLAMIEKAASDRLSRDPITYHRGTEGATDYANSYRTDAYRAITRAGRGPMTNVYGHTITDTDKERITARLVKAHKAELKARAAAL